MTRIWIIDDSAVNRSILAELAAGLDEHIEEAVFETPAAALAAAAQQPPDLVLTDFQMPEMDGAAFIAKFRQLPGCGEIPVIVVTTYQDREYRYAALEAGATDFLTSPIDHREFAVRARNLLTMWRQHLTILAHASRLREELDSSLDRLRAVADTVPAMISATDAEGRFVFANSFLAGVLGVDKDSIIGRPAQDLLGQEYTSETAAIDAAVLREGRRFPPYLEQLYTGGRRRVLLTAKSPAHGSGDSSEHVVTVSLDMTELEQSWLAGSNGSAAQRILPDLVSDFAVALDSAGIVSFVNAAFADAAGNDPQAFVGRPLSALFPRPDEHVLFLDDMRNATAADRQGRVRRYTGSDRSEHMIRWRFEPVRAALGSLVLAVGSRQASENPAQPDTIVSERARAADRERVALLESAKAELRRPLGQLVAVAGVLRSGVLREGDPRRDVYIETLYTTAQRLLATVNATLDVVEAGSKPLDEMDVHLVGSVVPAARVAARQPDGSQRRIAIDLPPSLPTVRIDPVQFERAVYSLIRYVLLRSPAAAELLIHATADSRTGMALLISAPDAEAGAGESSAPDNHPDASGLALAHEIAKLHGGTVRIVYEAASRSLVATLQLPPDRIVGRAA